MVNRVIFKGGTIATGGNQIKGDLLIEGEKVAAIGKDLPSSNGCKTMDVSGALILPGGVDIHTHLDTPLAGTVTTDDYETGSRAAAYGGTTTIVDFALHSKGKSLHDGVNRWKECAAGKSIIDYGLHTAVVELNDQQIIEMSELMEEGITSFKLFTVYRGVLMIDDGTMFKLLQLAKKMNALVMVHAESGDLIDALVAETLAEGKTAPRYHALTRPVEAEEESINRCIFLASMAGAPLYVVHVSTETGLRTIQEAQLAGKKVYAETCPHYLYLGHEVYEKDGFEAAKYVCSPPIRDRRHGESLWRGLANGTVQVLASDHCAFTSEQKRLGEDDFTKIPNGVPSLEARFLLGYQGVIDGKISLSRVIDAVATAPAKFAGLFPRKGTLLPGSDADLVVLDTGSNTLLSIENLHERNDYTPYEGININGRIQHTMVRGKFVIEDKKQSVDKGYGQFLKRGTFVA